MKVLKMITNLKEKFQKIDIFCSYMISYAGLNGPNRCPFCNGRIRKFVPFGSNCRIFKEQDIIGAGYRKNALCPRCHSIDRERLLYYYFKYKTNIFFNNYMLLHVAPEKHLQLILKDLKNIEYISCDLNSPHVAIKADLVNICFKADLFDIIICCHVLEHIPNDLKAMQEIYRILKSDGLAILQVPISLSLNETYEEPTIKTPGERENAFGQADHVRLYATDYKTRLEKIGFIVEVYNFTKEFGEIFTSEHGLNKMENLYICRKKNR